MCQFSVRVGAHVRGRATMAARAGARRLLSGAASLASPAVNELKAIKVDNRGNAWRVGVRVGGGHGLLAALHARDAPLLERTGSFGDTPATLTSRPGMLIARFQPFSAVIGDNCALLMDAHRASPKAAAGAIASAVSGRGRPAPPLVSAVGAAQSVDMDAGAHARISAPPDADADDAVDDFPLRALECVLDEATGYYHQKMRRLKLLTDYCLETITDELKTPGWGPGMAEAGFQRLLPLRRAMTELESDVREAHHAISDAMRSDERVDTLLPPPSRAAYGADRGDAKRDAERGADGIRERVRTASARASTRSPRSVGERRCWVCSRRTCGACAPPAGNSPRCRDRWRPRERCGSCISTACAIARCVSTCRPPSRPWR